MLFQIADVSKPLVSVSSICEKGNRVIFCRAGGMVQNLKTGGLIPFQRESGIYVFPCGLERAMMVRWIFACRDPRERRGVAGV